MAHPALHLVSHRAKAALETLPPVKLWNPHPTFQPRPHRGGLWMLCGAMVACSLLGLGPDNSRVSAQGLPNLDAVLAPTPASTPTQTPTPTPATGLPPVEGLPSLETLTPGGPLITPVPANLDTNKPTEELGAVVQRQQKRRDVDTKLSQIREAFAQGEFKKVLELVGEAEAIDRDNPNVKFYKDWANKKIRTGEGPMGAIINNPRLGQAQSTPNPAIPTPRSMRTPVAAVVSPSPTVAPTPVALAPSPTPAGPPAVSIPDVPSSSRASGSGMLGGYGPIAVAVGVAVVIIVLASLLLSRRTPLPTAPKIQYTPVPILPNMLAQQPLDGQSTVQMRRPDQTQDPQTLVVEDDEPAMASAPPPMAEFPGLAPGGFGGLGLGSLPSQPPPAQPMPAAPSPAIDVLPTVNEHQEDTMYAIEEDPYVPLPDPKEEPEEQAYGFYDAKTLELTGGENHEESTMVAGGPLPPSAFGMANLEDIDRTLPLTGPLPPSRFDRPPAAASAPASHPPAQPDSPVPAPVAPQAPVASSEAISLDAFSFDPDVTVPVAGKLPPSRFDVPPPPEAPQVPAEDVVPPPFLDLPDDVVPEPPPIPKQLLGVFPGKATPPPPAPEPPPAKPSVTPTIALDPNAILLDALPTPTPKPSPAKAPEAAPAPAAPPVPSLPPAPPGNESVIDLGSMGISFTAPSKAASVAPKEPEKPAKPASREPEAEPVIQALAGLGNISLAEVPTPPPGSYHPDDALAATSDLSPYGVDGALSATKTMDDYNVGEESIYGNPAISEAQQSDQMFHEELERGDRAAASGDWKKAVHFYAIAASIQSDHPELLEKLRVAREMKRQTDGH